MNNSGLSSDRTTIVIGNEVVVKIAVLEAAK